MRVIDRTTRRFCESVRAAVPAAIVTVQRSRNSAGRSNYVYISAPGQFRHQLKVRISDHPIGMARAMRGAEHLLLPHTAKPASWAVWVSELPARFSLPRVENSAIVR